MKDQIKRPKIAKTYRCRNLRYHDAKSTVEIAYKLHVSIGQVYYNSKRPSDFSTEIIKRKRSSRSTLNGFTEEIDRWIIEQEALPSKKRELRTVFYERCTKNPDFKASDGTLRRYISQRRKEIIPENVYGCQYVQIGSCSANTSLFCR